MMMGSSSSCSNSNLPRWLEHLLKEKFFNPCLIHECARKNEKNIFCLDCCTSICPHCFSPHHSHRLLQIRRYVYHDVIRLDDAQKLMDCAFVQAYTNNSAKVIFLNQRPQTRPFRGSGNICSTCDRSLQDPFLFCSLSCKIDYIVRREGGTGLSKYLYKCEFLQLPEPGCDLEEGLLTPDPILEPAGSMLTSSGSSGNVGTVGCKTLVCTATTEIVRKKRSSISAYQASCRPVISPGSEVSAGLMNRRKGTPQRAPLY